MWPSIKEDFTRNWTVLAISTHWAVLNPSRFLSCVLNNGDQDVITCCLTDLGVWISSSLNWKDFSPRIIAQVLHALFCLSVRYGNLPPSLPALEWKGRFCLAENKLKPLPVFFSSSVIHYGSHKDGVVSIANKYVCGLCNGGFKTNKRRRHRYGAVLFSGDFSKSAGVSQETFQWAQQSLDCSPHLHPSHRLPRTIDGTFYPSLHKQWISAKAA